MLSIYLKLGVGATFSSIAGFTLALIGQTYIFTWFYSKTKSLFICIIFHALLNTFSIIFAATCTQNCPIVGLAPALTTWIIAIIIDKFSKVELSSVIDKE